MKNDRRFGLVNTHKHISRANSINYLQNAEEKKKKRDLLMFHYPETSVNTIFFII